MLALCWAWADVGPMLPCWAILGPCWAYEACRAILGPCWAYAGACWASVAPILGHLEPEFGKLANFRSFKKRGKTLPPPQAKA